MPWYRINGMQVHVKLGGKAAKTPPAPCAARIPNGSPIVELRPVRKCMGLRPGEKLDVLRDPLIVVSVRREPLRAMTDDVEYGFRECELEGFGAHPDYRWPSAFVAMFCATHKGCTPETTVTRIEFAYHQDDGRLHG